MTCVRYVSVVGQKDAVRGQKSELAVFCAYMATPPPWLQSSSRCHRHSPACVDALPSALATANRSIAQYRLLSSLRRVATFYAKFLDASDGIRRNRWAPIGESSPSWWHPRPSIHLRDLNEGIVSVLEEQVGMGAKFTHHRWAFSVRSNCAWRFSCADSVYSCFCLQFWREMGN